MKNSIIITMLLALAHPTQAGSFKVEVVYTKNIDGGRRVYINSDIGKKIYSFSCEGQCKGTLEEALVQKPYESNSRTHKYLDTKGGLKFQKHNEFISETGDVFLMDQLFLKYEQLLLNSDEKELYLIGRESTELIYILTKKKSKYTIEIFTAKDAKKNEHLLTK